jgi:isocitrate lyase
MLLIARTDSESGKLISSNVDISDHEFIVGTTTKGTDSLAQVLAEAEAKGATGAEIDLLEKEWTESHHMCTFNEGIIILHCLGHLAHVCCSAVEAAIENSSIQDKAGAYQTYISAVVGKSNSAARSIAADILGVQVYWDWDCEIFFSID